VETSIEFDPHDVDFGVAKSSYFKFQGSGLNLLPIKIPAKNTVQAFNILELLIDLNLGG